MKGILNIKYFWLFIALLLVSCGRNPKKQEQFFYQELNSMLIWPQEGNYSDEIMKSVFEFIKSNPQSIEYEFEEELSHIRISTSEDGNVRAYNLERSGFEGNPSLGFECKTLLQYRSGESVFYDEYEKFNGYVTHIRHIDSNKYYLFEDYQGCICQGEHDFYSLSVYEIENNELYKLTGSFVNRNNVSDNLEFSWDDWGGHLELDYELEDSLFIYNKFNKELYVIKGMPLAGKALKYRQYNWNGQHFEIKKYEEPLEFENDKYYIRIEQQSENFWTYKCWNGGKKSGAPDLTINYGTKQYWLEVNGLISHDEWVTDDESSPLGEKYTFLNNGYRYEFSYGWSHGEQLELLYVYDPEEEMIYSGDFTPIMY